MSDKLVFSVSQLNTYVKSLLESDPNLTYVYVIGEISNFTNHYKTGHFYLSLKDDGALIKAVMFRSSAARIKSVPQNGMRVICRGRVSLYERDGQYQFYIDDMQPDGAGALQIAYEQLTNRLREEGLFEESRKKSIPKFPERIAIVTSPTGAAVQDMKNILGRRFPYAEIIMCPVLVQGDAAPAQLIGAVNKINKLKCADVIIIGRGGGSLEELWAFNDEGLARTVAASKIPVISAVGHETDYTICDFSADLRAPTPSAAAELAVPDTRDLLLSIRADQNRMRHSVERIFLNLQHTLAALEESRSLKTPLYFVERLKERLDYSIRDLHDRYTQNVGNGREKLALAAAKLDALSPLGTLKRGYSIVFKNQAAVKSVKSLSVSDRLSILLPDGSAECVVDAVTENPR